MKQPHATSRFAGRPPLAAGSLYALSPMDSCRRSDDCEGWVFSNVSRCVASVLSACRSIRYVYVCSVQCRYSWRYAIPSGWEAAGGLPVVLTHLPACLVTDVDVGVVSGVSNTSSDDAMSAS